MISIAPIPDRFLQRVRSEGLDDLGQPVKRVVAQGGEPCRDVLRRASAGEELLLASFTPFSKTGPYKEYGPIFVLAQPSGEDVRRDELPAAGGATDYLREQFVIRAYQRMGASRSGSTAAGNLPRLAFQPAELRPRLAHDTISALARCPHSRFLSSSSSAAIFG